MSENRLEFGDHGETEDEGPPLCTCGHRKDRHGKENFTRAPYCFDGCDCQGYDDGEADPVPPFPQEPAFGSPEAVAQAAETLRGRLKTLRLGAHPVSLLEQRDALADALESARNLVLDLAYTSAGGLLCTFGHKPGSPVRDGIETLAKIEEALRKAGR